MKQRFYAGKNINNNNREMSSSGGIFLPLAQYVIGKNGIVYGAIYNSKFEVCHSRADSMDEVLKMMGSKYSKSDVNGVFAKVADDLNDDKIVLFSGTPCQISALKKYLKEEKEKLITVDVVCHGTPERKYLADYIKYQQDKYNSILRNIDMRYKSSKEFNKNLKKKHIPIGKVEPHVMKLEFENNKKYIKRSDYDIFYQLFDYFISKGCFSCPFANLKRVSDITIGDFHEFSSKLGEFNDGNGISLVIVNTTKGETILDNISSQLELVEKQKDECIQPAISKPANMPLNKTQFDNDYALNGFSYIAKKYGKKGLKYNVRHFLYKIGILDKLTILRRKIK